MPNIKSAMKRDALSKAKDFQISRKSALKSSIKTFDLAVAEGKRDAAEASINSR